MDRSIMEGDPHTVIEGMILGAYAVGASHGYIYVRDEYDVAVQYLHQAVDDAVMAARTIMSRNISQRLGTPEYSIRHAISLLRRVRQP